jgi:hypothetical protein
MKNFYSFRMNLFVILRRKIHEDWGLISYDRARESYAFRQFHIRALVNQYLLNKFAEDGQTISFVNGAIENILPGWKAKESDQILGPEDFIEVCELAPPQKDFKIYSENHFKCVHTERG